MVLTTMVGKKRPFWRGLLLTIFTFGIYGIYWSYKAHDEVYKQFELQREGRDEGVVWLILGIIFFPLSFAYDWIFVSNVQYLRERLQLPKSLSPGLFVALRIGGYLVFFIGYLTFFFAILAVQPAAGEAPSPEKVTAAVMSVLGFFLVGALVFLVLVPYAYYRLQTDINGVWDAYEARMRTLSTPQPNVDAAPGNGASYRYWGDLQPPAAPAPPPVTLSVPHVRARYEAMVAVDPAASLPAGIPDLLARAEAGEPGALESAVSQMDAYERARQEDARVRAELEDVERKLGRLAGRLANGEVDASAYASARAQLERERDRLSSQIR